MLGSLPPSGVSKIRAQAKVATMKLQSARSQLDQQAAPAALTDRLDEQEEGDTGDFGPLVRRLQQTLSNLHGKQGQEEHKLEMVSDNLRRYNKAKALRVAAATQKPSSQRPAVSPDCTVTVQEDGAASVDCSQSDTSRATSPGVSGASAIVLDSGGELDVGSPSAPAEGADSFASIDSIPLAATAGSFAIDSIPLAATADGQDTAAPARRFSRRTLKRKRYIAAISGSSTDPAADAATHECEDVDGTVDVTVGEEGHAGEKPATKDGTGLSAAPVPVGIVTFQDPGGTPSLATALANSSDAGQPKTSPEATSLPAGSLPDVSDEAAAASVPRKRPRHWDDRCGTCGLTGNNLLCCELCSGVRHAVCAGLPEHTDTVGMPSWVCSLCVEASPLPNVFWTMSPMSTASRPSKPTGSTVYAMEVSWETARQHACAPFVVATPIAWMSGLDRRFPSWPVAGMTYSFAPTLISPLMVRRFFSGLPLLSAG